MPKKAKKKKPELAPEIGKPSYVDINQPAPKKRNPAKRKPAAKRKRH